MWGWVNDATPWPLYSRGIDPVPILQEASWTPTPVREGKENLPTKGIRSQDRPTRSKSLYRLGYPGPTGDYPSLFIRDQCTGSGHTHSKRFPFPHSTQTGSRAQIPTQRVLAGAWSISGYTEASDRRPTPVAPRVVTLPLWRPIFLSLLQRRC